MSKVKLIEPKPLNADAYVVSRNLTEDERKHFRLMWAKVNERSGSRKLLITIPEDVELKEIDTAYLRILRGQIDDVLKGRGEQ